MKNKSQVLLRLFSLFVFLAALLITFSCKSEITTETETIEKEASNSISQKPEQGMESEKNVTNDQNTPQKSEENMEDDQWPDNNGGEEIDKDAVRKEIFEKLLVFFTDVKVQKEYDYFSSYTKLMVGSKEEYISREKSDIIFVIQENHSSWEDVTFEKMKLYKERASLMIRGNRIVEGVKYKEDLQEFRFIKEDDSWKIDFYYPPIASIDPISPVPDSISDYVGVVEINFDAISFFPISDIEVYMNEELYNPDDIEYQSKYELKYKKAIPAFNAYRSINTIIVRVINIFKDEYEHGWSFVLG